MAALPVYRGSFDEPQAERLLWRAGFGPRPGQAARLARKGLHGAVHSLTRPGRERLVGPAPTDDKKRPLAPYDAWGHDHLWWLDRMVRTSRPLVERMALVWHDWFATSNDGVDSPRLMIAQNQLFRRHALGSFARLVEDVTKDPAMLLWLNGSDNSKWSPNENYARELMELFTLGADHGYSEDDVRNQARALTGWRSDWDKGVGAHNFRYDARYHDTDVKTVFGRRGRFTWRDSARLCVHHRAHPSFFVQKLWSYFVPTAPSRATQRALERLYVQHRYEVGPVVEAILLHPDFHRGPRMLKPPVVYTAGLLRAAKRGIDTTAWTWIDSMAGQQLFYPPNVAGWDDTRWLDTATFRGRWYVTTYLLRPFVVDTKTTLPFDAQELVDRAHAFWGSPRLRDETRRALVRFAQEALGTADESWKRKQYPALVENALRQLVAVSPDLQTC